MRQRPLIFLALAALTNGNIRITNLLPETRQPDILMLTLLERMGCQVRRGQTFVELSGTPQLKGGFEVSMKEMSDQALTVAALAPFADRPITICDVWHIRQHESDRIAVVCAALTQMDIQVEQFRDGLKVYPGTPKKARLHTHDDHRVAMSLALIGARVGGIELVEPNCVSKTCPNYFHLLTMLGLNIEYRSD